MKLSAEQQAALAAELKADDERIRSEYRRFMREASAETFAELLPRYLPTGNENNDEGA